MCTEYHTVLCNPNTRRSKSWCGLVAEKGRIPMLLLLAELHTKSTSAMEITAWSFSVLQYKRVLDLNSQFYQFKGSSKCRIFISPNLTSQSWIKFCMLIIQKSEFSRSFLRLGLLQPLKVILIFHPRIFGFLHHLLRHPPEQEIDDDWRWLTCRRPSKMRKLQKTWHHFLTQECCTWSKEWSNGTSWKRSFWCTWIVTWNGWHMAKHWPHMASSSQGVEDSSLEKATNVSYLIRFSLGNQQKLAPISKHIKTWLTLTELRK